jgi:alkylhydroperoxidase/carboxymuconolactone decarboxylase family protein YurZ
MDTQRQPTNSEEQLQGLAAGDLNVLETLVRMHEGTFEASKLDGTTYQLVRIAALTAIDGSPMSWLANLSMAGDLGVSADEILGTLVAIAPMVGTVRVVSAAGKIARALDLDEDLDEEEDEG